MKLILENSINYDFNIKDMELDPVTKRIIITGDKLAFIRENKIEKIITGKKVKNTEKVKYIKEANQLFISGMFFVSTLVGKVLKCDSVKKKILNTVFDMNKVVEFINFTTNGKIIYVENNILCSYDTVTNKTKKSELLSCEDTKGNYKIFISGENIILKYREIHTQKNIIKIFNEQLAKIFEIKVEHNHIHSAISQFKYIAGTLNGELEIWNILENELYNSIKISNSKITYIKKYERNYYVGTGNGEIIILDENFKVLNRENIFKNEIVKISVVGDTIFVLDVNNAITEYKIVDVTKKEKDKEFRENFLNEYNINKEYFEFFTSEKIISILNFLKLMEINGVEFTPEKDKIFKAFKSKISNRKVCLIGKDPYFQKGVATGLAFEVKKESWSDPEVNTSLKNMLKLIYKTYMGELKDINEIRTEIERGNFEILPPNKLFDSWEKQGVLLINAALTTIVGQAGEHHTFWNKFTHELIQYISIRNNSVIYFLWGKDAEIFEKDILSGDIIKHNHPAICGNLANEKDFLNGNSFRNTAHIINWTGYERQIENKTEKKGDRLF